MKIVVAVRCYNEEKNIPRFIKGYSFADNIVVSDGGSTDNSVDMLRQFPNVHLVHFNQGETVNGQFWNTDAPHMNFVLDEAKKLDPDWLIFDDMDDIPNFHLRKDARVLLERCNQSQVNAFRLYMWGDDMFFPHMNREFHKDYTSLWGWKPKEIDIHADPGIRHGTIVGTTDNHCTIDVPYCLLHKSWNPETIEAKIARYNALGLPMNHPLEFAGPPTKLPGWAVE